jgi:hypothetical protein
LANETPAPGHFLGIELRTADRLPALGARVTLEAVGVKPQTHFVQAGGSYLATHDSRLLFGWREDVDDVAIQVTWPDGAVERWDRLAADRYWLLYPGQPPIAAPGQFAKASP